MQWGQLREKAGLGMQILQPTETVGNTFFSTVMSNTLVRAARRIAFLSQLGVKSVRIGQNRFLSYLSWRQSSDDASKETGAQELGVLELGVLICIRNGDQDKGVAGVS